MSKVMDLSNVKNHPQKNGFDLSYRHIMTANVGQLLPCMVKDVLPSDKFSINLSWFSRTAPLNTCAYTRIREHVDCFFVPYRLLWRFSDLMFTGTSSLQSSFSYTSSQNTSSQGLSVAPPCFTQVAVRNFCKANVVLSGQQPGILSDDGGMNRVLGIVKLLDALGYGDWSFVLNSSSSSTFPLTYLNAFRLLAYQKIYSDFYRNEQWEDSKPTCFNVDYFAPSNGQVDVLNLLVQDITSKPLTVATYDNYNNSVFSLRYANYPKDLFTGVLPKPQFGGESYAPVEVSSGSNDLYFTINSNSSSTNNLVVDSQEVKVNGNTETPIEVALKDVFSPDSLNSINGQLSILELRKAQAVQRWKEITNCHKKSYKAQLEAHYDVNVSDDRSDMVKYLGGNVRDLNINEVVNTNLVDSNPNIGGTGQGSGETTINFTAPEHGIIMAIYYAEPLLDYSDTIDAFNLKTENEDYFVPEFDKLGMQPLSIFNLTSNKNVISHFQSDNKHDFLGYVPRYAEYKTSFDKVSITAKQAFPSWVCPLDAKSLLITGLNTSGANVLIYRTTYQMFKIRPFQLNPLFKAQISLSTGDFLSDQLLINFNNSIKALRPMDVNGLPY